MWGLDKVNLMKSLFQISGIKDRLTWHHIKQQSGMKRSKFSTLHSLPAVAGNKGRAIQTPTNEPNTRAGTDHPIPTPPKLYGGGNKFPKLFPSPTVSHIHGADIWHKWTFTETSGAQKIMKRGRRCRGHARMPTSGRRPV